MSQQKIKWGRVERFFLRRGYTIRSSGGDKFIVAPKDSNPSRMRCTVLIGHHYCGRAGDELANGHLSAIKRSFGFTRQEILNDK